MNKDRITMLAHLMICILGGVAIFLIGVRFLFPALLPFIIAWAIAFAVRPVAKRLSSAIKVPERILRVFFALITLAALVSVVVFLVLRVGSEVIAFFSGIGENERFMDILAGVLNPTLGKLGEGEIFEELERKLALAINEMISQVLSGISSYITTFASRIPGIFIFLLAVLISSVYFSYDLERINAAARRILPRKMETIVVRFKEKTLSVALKYLRSYLLLMLITFVIILAGLLFLRVEYALLLALIIALLDVLPVIGVGTILVPWSIWCFIFGDVRLGIGLVALFIVNELVRQFAEPRIVGRSLGIHPLLTLVMLYVGYSFFGIVGLLLMPVFSVVLNTLLTKDKPSEVEQGSAAPK